MAIVAGIDEAGYGPILGPLVVSAVAFEVPDERCGCDLWQALQCSVTRTVRKGDARLPIVDSKKLHHSPAGLAAVERTALAMLAAGGSPHRQLTTLLGRVCPEVHPDLGRYPWYRDFDPPLPLACSPTLVTLKANGVANDLRRNGMHFLGVRSCVLLEGQYNDMVNCTRNKATVLWSLTLRLISRLARTAGRRSLTILIDRQGGRTTYAPPLLTAFPGAHLEICHEAAELGRYRLYFGRPAGDPVELEFRQEAESSHLPVALASVYSKYLREVFMVALNRYWQDKIGGLKRTAGYYQDGRRFLKDIAPAMASLATDPRMLIRCR